MCRCRQLCSTGESDLQPRRTDKRLHIMDWSLFFAAQIYGDFSGYSDIARGLGYMFGFRIPVNFEWPYFSRSMLEFWQRWHITLSSFIRDYVYTPLGIRVGRLRLTFNVLLV